MEHYNTMVLRSYLDQPKKYVPPRPNLSVGQQVAILMPTLKKAELHEYPKEQVLVLEGENLWFTYKIKLDDGGRYEYELEKPHTVTKCTLQFNFRPSKKVSLAIVDGGKVKVTLHTHFVTKVVKSVECKKVSVKYFRLYICFIFYLFSLQKPFSHSVRQMQLAKLTPSQVIKLAYLSTLLEQQQPKSNTTKRNLKTICFLDEAVKVVPVESVLDAITYARHDFAVECAKALNASRLTLQPTKLMGTGLFTALFRAIHGISGEAVEEMINESKLDDPERSATPPFHLNKFFMGAFGKIPGFTVPSSTSTMHGNTHQPYPTSSGSPFQSESTHTFPSSYSSSASQAQTATHDSASSAPPSGHPPSHRASISPLYTEVVAGKASATMSPALTPSTALQQGIPPFQRLMSEQHLVHINDFFVNVVQIVPTFIIDPRAYPDHIHFPADITHFLWSIVRGLDERARNLGYNNLELVGKTNLEEIYPASTTIRRNMLLESPRRCPCTINRQAC